MSNIDDGDFLISGQAAIVTAWIQPTPSSRSLAMKAFTFAVLYTAALSSYMSTLSFAAPSVPTDAVQQSSPAAVGTGVLVLDRLA